MIARVSCLVVCFVAAVTLHGCEDSNLQEFLIARAGNSNSTTTDQPSGTTVGIIAALDTFSSQTPMDMKPNVPVDAGCYYKTPFGCPSNPEANSPSWTRDSYGEGYLNACASSVECYKRGPAWTQVCGESVQMHFTTPPLPTSPGCHVHTPCGCPSQVGKANWQASWKWVRDDWGERFANAGASLTECQARADDFARWCQDPNIKMHFVGKSGSQDARTFWRLQIARSWGDTPGHIYEIELYEGTQRIPNSEIKATTNTPLTSDTDGHDADKAFDDNEATYFQTAQLNDKIGMWITIELSKPRSVTKVRMKQQSTNIVKNGATGVAQIYTIPSFNVQAYPENVGRPCSDAPYRASGKTPFPEACGSIWEPMWIAQGLGLGWKMAEKAPVPMDPGCYYMGPSGYGCPKQLRFNAPTWTRDVDGEKFGAKTSRTLCENRKAEWDTKCGSKGVIQTLFVPSSRSTGYVQVAEGGSCNYHTQVNHGKLLTGYQASPISQWQCLKLAQDDQDCGDWVWFGEPVPCSCQYKNKPCELWTRYRQGGGALKVFRRVAL